MLVSEVEALVVAVVKSLADTPRTSYEAENLYLLNRERIAAARAALADMSGDYVTQLLARCNEAERQAEAKRAGGHSGVEGAAAGNAFSLDFAAEDADEDADAAEVEAVVAGVAAGGGKRPSKRSGAKTKTKKPKSSSSAKAEKTAADHDGEEPRPGASPPAPSAAEVAKVEEAAVPRKPRWTVVERQTDLASSDLPPSLLTSGRGACEPVDNAPLARLYFTDAMDWDGLACRCAVELYRCVVVALAHGEPLLTWEECQRMAQAQLAAGVSTGRGTVSSARPVAAAASSFAGAAPASVHHQSKSGAEREALEDDEELDGDEERSGEDLTLSEQLIADYEQAQLAEAQQDLDTSALPRDVTERLQRRLRGFTSEVWVILLCHGGYFAGGVFVRGACVLHKAFQRYVVRKKQGGKQSSNAKDGGSYNSVGSQIRAAQEVKWRIDVRDILLDWTPYIRAASFILYAAPGPQNRAVLTDFSLLPAVAALGGEKGVSPIQLKDPRVSRVPITTHRPTFEEVQRIYSVCSRCSLLYVRDEEGSEP